MADASPATRSRSERAFWILWGFDAFVAAVVVFFFVWGLADGTVSSFNIVLWLGMLAGVGAVVGGSLALRNAGHAAAAFRLLFVIAFPGLAIAVFLLLLIVLQPSWN
jgi:hypothetical protein